jgi:carboxypeptidase PM20D1
MDATLPTAEANEAALERLQQLVRIPTMSNQNVDATDWAAFDRFIAAVERLYPGVHEHLERELVAGHTMLFRWPGRSAGPASVLMAHYDVVAAADEGWQHPPFAAEVTGEGATRVVWGRGTLDDKGSLTTVLEAAERRVAAGFTPEHDVYLLFGHDEETAGSGAKAAAARLEQRGVRIGLVLDEGGAVVEHVFPTVDVPVAVVGVSEKGTANITLTVTQEGGHASTPPRMTATSRLARAITRLSRPPFRPHLNPVTVNMVRTFGEHARNPVKAAIGVLSAVPPLLVPVLARLGVETNAMIRTTIAVTQLSGSPSANALAETARAVVNARIALDSSVAETVGRIRRAIRDPKVLIGTLEAWEPSPISEMSGPVWDRLVAAIADAYPDAVATPYVQTGATDSRQLARLSRNVYRFSPFAMSADERATLHARDERMHVETFFTGIRFYEGLIGRL